MKLKFLCGIAWRAFPKLLEPESEVVHHAGLTLLTVFAPVGERQDFSELDKSGSYIYRFRSGKCKALEHLKCRGLSNSLHRSRRITRKSFPVA